MGRLRHFGGRIVLLGEKLYLQSFGCYREAKPAMNFWNRAAGVDSDKTIQSLEWAGDALVLPGFVGFDGALESKRMEFVCWS